MSLKAYWKGEKFNDTIYYRMQQNDASVKSFKMVSDDFQVLHGRLGVMNRTWADDDDQTVVFSMED